MFYEAVLAQMIWFCSHLMYSSMVFINFVDSMISRSALC